MNVFRKNAFRTLLIIYRRKKAQQPLPIHKIVSIFAAEKTQFANHVKLSKSSNKQNNLATKGRTNRMCTVSINIDEAVIRDLRPDLDTTAAIRSWVQELIDARLQQMHDQCSAPPPCQYTEEEVVQRVVQATADVDASRGLMALDEFEKLVETW